MKTYVIEKKNADLFFVEGKGYKARKNLKTQGIFVGDKIVLNEKEGVIEKVLERKNYIIRPPIANLDKMFIVIAPIPKPDFYLVDKLIIFCKVKGIEPALVVNKTDLMSEKEILDIKNIYSSFLKVVFVSAEKGDVVKLKKEVKGICAFAGQSAVGKSSLINAIFEEAREKVGLLSKKVERGKQTTRVVCLHHLGGKNYLADTAGFSKLDENLLNIEKNEICKYFDEFIEFLPKCEFNSCSHIVEKKCGIKDALKLGKISEQRYNSYVKLFEVLSGKGR